MRETQPWEPSPFSQRQFFVELSSEEAEDYDFYVRPAGDGRAPVLPEFLELPDGGTLTFLDAALVERSLTDAPAGYRNCIQVRKILTCTERIRLGTATPAGLPGAVGARGQHGGRYTVTGVKTGDYTASAGEFVRVSTAAAHTITLPTAVGIAGLTIAVKDAVGAGAATNNITIATTSAQTINGTTPVAIATDRGAVTYVSDGANWQILSAA